MRKVVLLLAIFVGLATHYSCSWAGHCYRRIRVHDRWDGNLRDFHR